MEQDIKIIEHIKTAYQNNSKIMSHFDIKVNCSLPNILTFTNVVDITYVKGFGISFIIQGSSKKTFDVLPEFFLDGFFSRLFPLCIFRNIDISNVIIKIWDHLTTDEIQKKYLFIEFNDCSIYFESKYFVSKDFYLSLPISINIPDLLLYFYSNFKTVLDHEIHPPSTEGVVVRNMNEVDKNELFKSKRAFKQKIITEQQTKKPDSKFTDEFLFLLNTRKDLSDIHRVFLKDVGVQASNYLIVTSTSDYIRMLTDQYLSEPTDYKNELVLSDSVIQTILSKILVTEKALFFFRRTIGMIDGYDIDLLYDLRSSLVRLYEKESKAKYANFNNDLL